ncbi:ABC transporter permease [Armatimonas sp.]|uniref:ABC transporter permease n=1 Tax=Armatimonas sp. TaxID=1872638 RepID=UPI00375186ED
MIRLIFTRLGLAIPTLLAISFLVFFATYLSPADPVDIMLGQHATPESRARLQHQLGLDLPPLVRYGNYVFGIVTRGDFGRSYFNNGEPVLELIKRGFPNTGVLASLALLFSLGIGIPIGILAAVKANKFMDRAVMSVALIGVAVPSFVLAPLLTLYFAVQRNLLPPMGFALGDTVRAQPQFFILPAIVLGARSAALMARMTRSAMLDVLGQDYIRTARAKGLSSGVVLFKHALKNAFPPIMTVAGTTFGYLLSGSFVVETFFQIPGLGYQSIFAIQQRDYPVIQGLALLMAFIFVVVNLIVDILYGVLDPRARAAGGKR